MKSVQLSPQSPPSQWVTEREEIVVKAAQKYEDTKTRVRTFNKPLEKRFDC